MSLGIGRYWKEGETYATQGRDATPTARLSNTTNNVYKGIQSNTT